MTTELDPRLEAAASFVPRGAVLADVGTDHAYLPVRLLTRGIIPFAVVSDINRGPLENARSNARRAGVEDRMRFVLADGLSGVEPERDGVTHIAVCGMGGELIAKIVAASDYTRRADVRLILGPMSMPDKLRQYLAAAGYAILDEKLCISAGKLYTCLNAAYDGRPRSFTEAEYLLGAANIRNREPLFEAFAGEWLRRIETRINGLKSGGHDASADERLYNEIRRILEEGRTP